MLNKYLLLFDNVELGTVTNETIHSNDINDMNYKYQIRFIPNQNFK